MSVIDRIVAAVTPGIGRGPRPGKRESAGGRYGGRLARYDSGL